MDPKSKEYLRLNKNILAAFAASLAVSAMAAQLLAEHDDYLNTTYVLAVDYAVYFAVFGGMFYMDNRAKYLTDSGQIDGVRLRRDLVKIIGSLGAGELVYTASRWFFHFYFLTAGHDPYLASIMGHVISAAIYAIVINLSVKIVRLFKDGG